MSWEGIEHEPGYLKPFEKVYHLTSADLNISVSVSAWLPHIPHLVALERTDGEGPITKSGNLGNAPLCTGGIQLSRNESGTADVE